jgi:hypothetical protein
VATLAKNGSPDLVEENLVADGRSVSLLGPVELVLVAKLEQLLSHDTLLLDRVSDVLVNPGNIKNRK